MKLELPYGAATIQASMNWGHSLGTIAAADAPALAPLEAAVSEALEHPIGQAWNIYQIVRPGETVALVVSDIFRQTRADQFLPILVNGLNRAGIPDDAMLITFATGVHRAPTPGEQRQIVGESLYNRFAGRLFAHDPRDESNLRRFGVTSRGTEVRLNKRVFDCDRVIVTGAVVLHYFGGFGGGRKGVLPGLAAEDTISHNHSMNLDRDSDRLDPRVRIGALDGNPVAEDMLEGARMARVDYLVNTVLNSRSEIAGVFAGELVAAHRKAAEFAYRQFAVHIERQADLVIAASPGTRNFVQTHKSLFNAYQAMRPGGVIILLAECREGLGGDQFVKWLRLRDRPSVIAGLRERSEINGQTALSTLEKAPSAIMVTELRDEEVMLLGARKARNLDEAMEMARVRLDSALSGEPGYYVMPSAPYTVPLLAPKETHTPI
ncbi:MAG: nickel-dependent lactate racemase [Candidatus Hydrogenedentes bacterium]|nr:nickel-dependent lactate racemase [Candidatus Hydrogenedentota bacterium]